jgi:hypothetical protein
MMVSHTPLRMDDTSVPGLLHGYGQGKSSADALRHAQMQLFATLRAHNKKAFGEALAPVHLWVPFIIQQTES